MSSNSSKRAPTTATQRLKQDYLRIKKDPVPYICLHMCPGCLLNEWQPGPAPLGWCWVCGMHRGGWGVCRSHSCWWRSCTSRLSFSALCFLVL
uniref:Uncharacterized protein n=1 Tax=Ursus americanus TaxID=9643 RepID=A0A452Q9L2_URSAM